MKAHKISFGIGFGNGLTYVWKTDDGYVSGSQPVPPGGMEQIAAWPTPVLTFYTPEEVNAFAESASHTTQ